MSEQQSIDTPENWDAASKGYAEKVAPFLMEAFSKEFIERLDVNDGADGLEVAAGSGALTEALSKRVKSLLATDFSPKMIDLVERRIKNAGIKNVTFESMDGQSLNLDDATFDRAACSFGLMLFPDRHKGFLELNRVVRPGGRAMVSGWAGPDKFEVFRLFMEGIQKAFPDFPKPPSPPPVFSLADPADFKTQMEAGGFREVEVDFVSRELVVDGFNDLWAMLTAGAPPTKMLFDRVGSEGKNRIHDALADIVERRFGSGSISMTNTATVGCGNVG